MGGLGDLSYPPFLAKINFLVFPNEKMLRVGVKEFLEGFEMGLATKLCHNLGHGPKNLPSL